MNAVPASGNRRRRWPWVVAVGIVVAVGVAGGWWGSTRSKQDAQAARKTTNAVPVVTARSESRDVPVRVRANGIVTALQTVDLRAQITSTVREVHIREGQGVQKGDLLFSLDARAEEANLRKAEAQVEKDRADLATANRDLERQRELYAQKFISQAALDAVQNKVDTLKGQMAVDQAAVESARVARAYTEIRAPFAGRTGVIAVRAGSLVQPSQNTATSAPPLVTITQIDPISVAFTLPEQELPTLQQALRAGSVPVTASAQFGEATFKGRITFVDNAVDTATGTIRVKAEFANGEARLWPGMYVNVELAPRTIANATVIPAQSLQNGPDGRFVYTVGGDNKVSSRPVQLAYLEEGFAVVKGIEPGVRVVAEGAQNLRPGSVVAEAARETSPSRAPASAGAGPGPRQAKK
jgi:RND family efflux transporter MFP subunit